MVARLDGHVALVTGAGQGIGRGIARRLASESAKVAVIDINEETGRSTAKELEGLGGQGIFINADVREKHQIQKAVHDTVERFGRLDVLVNNAWGGATFSRLEEKTDEDVRHNMDTTFMAAFWSMQAAFPYLRSHQSGSIINICALHGVNAHRYTLEYNTAKEALRTLTRTAAVEWGQYGIRCNAICPLAASEGYLGFQAVFPELAAELLDQNPMGRLGDPELDIGSVALFLASDDSAYLTGNTLFVDGGAHINGVQWNPPLHIAFDTSQLTPTNTGESR